MNDRIYRTREDRMVLGVLGGLSLRFGIDPSIARVAYVVVMVLTGIVPLLILYFVMAIVVPDAPPGWEAAVRAAGPTTPAPPPAWMQAPPPGAWPPAEQPATPAGPATPAWPATGGPATSAGPPPTWGAGWDASGRPISGETAEHARDSRAGAIVGGLVLVGIGGAFLLAQIAPQLDWGLAGPILLIALGVVLVLASIRRA